MAPLNPHRIRRLRWRVRVRSQSVAFTLRQRLRDELDAVHLPSLSAALDDALPGDEVVRLDRLDVHVTVASLDDLDAALRLQVREALRRACPAAVRERPAVVHPSPTPVLSVGSEIAAVARYLSSGSLPWPFASMDRGEVLAWLRPVVDAHIAALLSTPGARHYSYFFRLLQLLPAAAWERVTEAWAALSPTAWDPARIEALSVLATWSAPDHERLHFTALALAGPEALVDEAPSMGVGVSVTAPDGGVRPGAAGLDRLPATARAYFEARGVRVSVPSSTDGATPVAAPRPPNAPAPLPAPPPRAEPEDLGVPVMHAGLVLLHPFIARFFEHVGLKPPGERALPPASLPRAASLLSLLSLGTDEPYEFELGVIKVLLGLHPETHLAVAPGLMTARDHAEADALLGAVIGHWPSLKNTSINGLRTSFLQRRGTLRSDERGWRLRVEERPFDVLLGGLPWHLSMIRLPWMPRLLMTEWRG